jgi:hypothetical protein
MDGTGLESCQIVVFDIMRNEPSYSATIVYPTRKMNLP